MRTRLFTALLAVTLALVAIALSSARTDAVVPGANGKIVFTSTRDANSEIYVMNPDGSGQKNLTKDPASKDSPNDYTPTWSPDGRRIAFHSRREGHWGVWVMSSPS